MAVAVVIILIALGSIICIGFLLSTAFKRSNHKIRRYVKALKSTQTLSEDDLDILKFYYPEYQLDPNIYDLTGLFHYDYIVAGAVQGNAIREGCYFIDNLEVTYINGISKQQLDNNLNQTGNFQILVYRDATIMRTRVAIVSFFNDPVFIKWLSKKRIALYTQVHLGY